MLTRRDVLILTLIGTIAEAADFLKDKKPSEWSDKDIEKLLTRSPWAKDATVSFNMAGMEGGPGGMRGGGPPGGGMGGPSGGGMGGPPGGVMGGPPGGAAGGPGGGGMPEFHATVRWESAAPVRAARRSAVATDGQYVISVTGLPLGPRNNGNHQPDRTELLTRLAGLTDLERKGKDSINCSRADMSQAEDSNSLLFYFDPGPAPIRPEDKEITFNTKMGPLQVKAKFVLKEMMFEGKLAL
jgi:hypothetical protein